MEAKVAFQYSKPDEDKTACVAIESKQPRKSIVVADYSFGEAS